MAATPKKLVHWALDVSMSEFGTPFSEASSSDAGLSALSLQYINSQLIAHGFTHNPGLSLDGLQKEDEDRVVKCLLGMLSQRIDDMSRTEDLATKIRTLSYEHERLMSMYKTAKDKAANAEREMNTHKSRLASATQALQTSENAHKRTTAELQRMRTTLQSLRATHVAEIKKIEKEKDRMVDRWNKLSDSQLKLGTVPSGIKFANAQVVEASDVQLRGKGQGFLEIALEQASKARDDLVNENRSLKGLTLSTANELQRVLHSARSLSSSENQVEPSSFTLTSLFPLSPSEAAEDKLTLMLSSLKELTERLAHDSKISKSSSTSSASPDLKTEPKPKVDTAEVERLQVVINTLSAELENAQKESAKYGCETQALFDRFAANERLAQGPRGQSGDISVDLMTVPARDEEKEKLDKRCRDLEEERKKFTEAAVRLGKEKAVLEAERIEFLEEKRSWQVEMMLSDLPPTPQPVASSSSIPQNVPPKDVVIHRSPRKSPRKVKKSSGLSGVKKTRVSRRSSSGIGLSPTSPRYNKTNKLNAKVIPPFETEVIPSSSASISAMPPFTKSLNLAASQLPHAPPPPPLTNAFVLPPPSPAASLQSKDIMLSSAFIPPLPKFKIPQAQLDDIPSSIPSDPDNRDEPPTYTHAPDPSTMTAQVPTTTAAPAVPSTPGAGRPFPIAKPLAQRMIHAYSPVKPSPLSRILMLANSPESPGLLTVPSLGALTEEDESSGPEISPTPAPPLPPPALTTKVKSLAAELGIAGDDEEEEVVEDEEEDDESPLREKKVEKNFNANHKSKRPSATSGRLMAKEKGKPRATDPRAHVTSSRNRLTAAGAVEKENKIKRAIKSSASGGLPGVSGTSSRVPSGGIVKKRPAATASTTKPVSSSNVTVQPKPALKVKGGARRVPIDSAEAAPTGPAWKG